MCLESFGLNAKVTPEMCKCLLDFSFVTLLVSVSVVDADKLSQLCFGWRYKTVLANFLPDFLPSLCQLNLKSLCFYMLPIYWVHDSIKSCQMSEPVIKHFLLISH